MPRWVRVLLGLILGGGLGLVAGLVVGLVGIDLFEVSCFEGYCGYLVVLAYAPGGLILGAIAGAVLGWGRRKEVTAATMSVPPILMSYIAGLKAHDVAAIGRTVAAELRFVTPMRTMGKPQFLAFLTALYTGFPDWRYDCDPPVLQADGRWAVRWRQGGTHAATLALPGFPAVPATGRTVAIPEHDFFYRVACGLIVEIEPDPVPGGAPRGIFEQIGVELPPL